MANRDAIRAAIRRTSAPRIGEPRDSRFQPATRTPRRCHRWPRHCPRRDARTPAPIGALSRCHRHDVESLSVASHAMSVPHRDPHQTGGQSGPGALSQDGRRSAAQYDAMAAVYATANAAGPFNAYYERPATIAMLAEIRGQRVLEIGCGAGPLSEWLVEQGARLTAIDVSPAMGQLAERRLGSRAGVFQADLGSGLGFAAAESFDVVVASLVMHYLRDWDAALSEVRRVLAPSGRFLFSTHHPTADARLHSPEDYFAVMEVTEEWGGEEWGGK